mmetsp:Transcript_26756/g.26667  ORF Transcript_26756/g.26667 Transcript_26756/m.26667 type:complete len:100 (+) Transcript_26756:566-865(+)
MNRDWKNGEKWDGKSRKEILGKRIGSGGERDKEKVYSTIPFRLKKKKVNKKAQKMKSIDVEIFGSKNFDIKEEKTRNTSKLHHTLNSPTSSPSYTLRQK